jgi:tetratricopeptide (TPR) repeat protein
MKTARGIACTAVLLLIVASSLPAQGAGQSQSQNRPSQSPEIQQAYQMERDGDIQGALAIYEKGLKAQPDSYPLNAAAGVALDLLGHGNEARKHFEKAIAAGDTPEHKAIAERAEAMSYAFEGNCRKADESEEKVFDYFVGTGDFYEQGEMSDEAARVCLDSGDFDMAEKLYRRGHDVGLKEPNIKPARVDLWDFRWENALARLAIRRGNREEAEKHIAAAKAIFDKGTNPEQAPFMPALVGYVDFYAGDFQAALEQLQQANQRDAFIQCLIAQSYEKLGNKANAVEFYRKAAAALSHNPPAAYAVPFSRKKLAALGN